MSNQPKKYRIQIFRFPYHLLGDLILKWEMKGFGWKAYGRENREDFDGYETTVTDHGSYYSANTRAKYSHSKWISFRRPFGYKKGPIFWLLELIMTFNQYIRKWIYRLIWLFVIAIVVLMIGGDSSNALTYVLLPILGTWAISFVLPLIARIIRVIYKNDEKTDDFLMDAGLDPWTSYDEYE